MPRRPRDSDHGAGGGRTVSLPACRVRFARRWRRAGRRWRECHSREVPPISSIASSSLSARDTPFSSPSAGPGRLTTGARGLPGTRGPCWRLCPGKPPVRTRHVPGALALRAGEAPLLRLPLALCGTPPSLALGRPLEGSINGQSENNQFQMRSACAVMVSLTILISQAWGIFLLNDCRLTLSTGTLCACVCTCMCVHTRACVCARVCTFGSTWECMCVHVCARL